MKQFSIFVATIPWVLGIFLATTTAGTAASMVFPPYAYYVVAGRIVTTYYPELLR